jgi:hypothetical protein
VAPTTTTTEEVTAGRVRVTCPLTCRINETTSVKQTSQNESFFKLGIGWALLSLLDVMGSSA